MIPTDRPNIRLLDRLSIVVGLFGERGWPEIEVVDSDGVIRVLPLATELASKVQYARKVLAEFDRQPMPPNKPIPVECQGR